ncbi:hypothetical protein HKX48_001765 [Thoreauomyces humboldtii]|nr:hypothetical protein HKX48_001765 [Thoreauomyces humboldtii]
MAPVAVLPAREYVDDGHEVFSQLSWSVLSAAARARVAPIDCVDDQVNSTSVEKKFKDVESDTGKLIALGDNNLLDKAFDAFDDQTLNTGALEIHSLTDIFDNCASGILFGKIGD